MSVFHPKRIRLASGFDPKRTLDTSSCASAARVGRMPESRSFPTIHSPKTATIENKTPTMAAIMSAVITSPVRMT
jgi:hypothetical protein